MTNTFKGYALGILAASAYGLNPLFALPVYAEGMNADSVLFFRYLIAIPIVAVMLVMRGRSLAVNARDIIPLALMGIITALSSLFLFESYYYMNAGIASTILFIYPVLVAVLMALFYHERLSGLTVGCMTVALAGILLLCRTSDGAVISLTGTVLSVLSGLAYAIYIVAASRPRFKRLPTLKMLFYVLLFGTFVFVVRLMWNDSLTIPSDARGWVCVSCLALLPTAVSFGCTTAAIQYIGSTPTAILGALEPVTAVLVAVFVFGEPLSPREWLGIALILGAVSMVAGGTSASAALVRIRRMFPNLRHRK